MGRGSKPGERRGGRQKGTPNKLTADLKATIEGALAAVGGQVYLETVARKHPPVFCALLGRLLPRPQEPLGPDFQEDQPRDAIDVARRILFALEVGRRQAEAQEKKEREYLRAQDKPNSSPPSATSRT